MSKSSNVAESLWTETAARDVTTWIYALVDPRDGLIRYVGSTVNPTARLSQHLTNPLTRNKLWLSELKQLGMKPRLDLLCAVPPGHNWVDEERFWIEYHGWRTSIGKAQLSNREWYGRLSSGFCNPLDDFATYNDLESLLRETQHADATQTDNAGRIGAKDCDGDGVTRSEDHQWECGPGGEGSGCVANDAHSSDRPPRLDRRGGKALASKKRARRKVEDVARLLRIRLSHAREHDEWEAVSASFSAALDREDVCAALARKSHPVVEGQTLLDWANWVAANGQKSDRNKLSLILTVLV